MIKMAFKKKLSVNWKLQSSEKADLSGKEISIPEYRSNDWYHASVPSTVLATLVDNHVYRDPYFGKNMEKIPPEQFNVPWWYRTEFDLSPEQINKTVLISFDGINYKANIWLNSKQIVTSQTANGAFRRIKFDITENIIPGKNVLAVEVIPPKPGDFSIGFVDWNLDPPDNNMGIFRDVTLHFNSGVSVENPFVETHFNTEIPKQAALTVTTELVNYTNKTVSGILKGAIDKLLFSKPVTLAPGELKCVSFTPEEFLELNILKPQLWWPNNLGNPSLYKLELFFEINKEVSDFNEVAFGIRKVEDYINEGGHRGFKINGHKVLIKGAGWTDDLFLQDTHESLEAQIAYVKHMNLNCIRLEGFWGKDQKLYDLCDQNGILIMAGWSCHWEHEQYLGKPIDPRYGGITEPEEINLIAQSWEDQILWVRNHPSIFVWTVGSDMVPHPELEKKYIETFNKYDRTRPYLNSTGGVGSEQGIITETEIVSEISGSSRVKMLGPYAYTPPIYWYTNKNLGGAYGFNTETCPGANVPALESIKKMIPENHLWPVNKIWEFHCGKNDFSTLDRYQKAISARYGKASDVTEFAKKAQLLNYELMRPMFEAFQANKYIATGIIQWMLNSAWPNMYWQLYDTFLMPNGAFYGTKKACEPIHLLYNYGTHSVYMINDTIKEIKNHWAQIRIFNINSSEIFNETVKINTKGESSSAILELPDFKNITTTYFLDLRLHDEKGNEITNNFYWLSAKEDVLDYEAEFEDWPFYTPSKEYADLSQLNTMPKVSLAVNYNFEVTGDKQVVKVVLKNPADKIAFFIDLNVAGKKSGKTILPLFWDDNYFSLLPGETKEINATYAIKDMGNEEPVLNISGWNVEEK